MAEKGLEEEIDEVLVPTEEVVEIRRGKKVTAERRFMPGYVLVRMEMNDRTYHLVNSINRVTGFLGPQGKPSPMRDDEVNAILSAARGWSAGWKVDTVGFFEVETPSPSSPLVKLLEGLAQNGGGSYTPVYVPPLSPAR